VINTNHIEEQLHRSLETTPSPNPAHQRRYIELQKLNTHNLQQTKTNQTKKNNSKWTFGVHNSS
jgi:hypothetical protein